MHFCKSFQLNFDYTELKSCGIQHFKSNFGRRKKKTPKINTIGRREKKMWLIANFIQWISVWALTMSVNCDYKRAYTQKHSTQQLHKIHVYLMAVVAVVVFSFFAKSFVYSILLWPYCCRSYFGLKTLLEYDIKRGHKKK